MAVSDDIFLLVKSMARAERAYSKRYLKMHAAGKESSMLSLFEALEKYAGKTGIYDEDALKKDLDKKLTRHLPVIKNNLYNILLRSLQEFASGRTPEEKVKRLIEQYDTLYSKALFKQCGAVLRKAITLAEENEVLSYQHILLAKKSVLARYTEDVERYNMTIAEIYKEQNLVLAKIKNTIDLANLSDRYTSLLQKNPTGFARDSEAMSEMQKFMEHPLLSDESKILTKTALANFYTFRCLFCQNAKDFEGALAASKKRLEITEERFLKDRSRLGPYIVTLYSVLVYSIRTRRLGDYDDAYRKLKNLTIRFPGMSEQSRMQVFYYSAIPELSLCNETLDIQRGDSSLREIIRDYEKLESKIPAQQKIILFFFLGAFNFVKGDYDESSKWLGRLINMPNVDLSQDYQCYARIMYLLVHYELGRVDSIEHVLKSTYHFLYRRNKVYKYEKIILEYMRKSFRVNSGEELMEMFVFMRRDLQEIENDEFEQNAFDAFNLLPWLDSKIENIPYIEAARRRGGEAH